MNTYFKKKPYILLHLLIWAILFLTPYLLSVGHKFTFTILLEAVWIPLLISAVLFYINYFMLVERFFYKQKTAAFIVCNLFLIVIFTAIKFLVRLSVLKGLIETLPNKGEVPPIKIFIYLDALSLIIPIVCAVTLKVFERWLKAEQEKKELENARLQSELELLKYQLQPHFFFNSLNNIFALVDLDQAKAKHAILALSTLMRYLLYESNVPRITLRKETEFIRQYIALMQLRTSDVKVTMEFDTIHSDVSIAPLLLVPLIENAFKHGVSASRHNPIEFRLTVSEHTIIFETVNNYYPNVPKDKKGHGIGLNNVRTRLQLLYPDSNILKTVIDKNKFKVMLQLNITTDGK